MKQNERPRRKETILHESGAGEKIIVANYRTAELAECIASHAVDACKLTLSHRKLLGITSGLMKINDFKL